MNWLKTLLSGTSGDPSTMRAAVFIIVLAVMVTWTVNSIRAGTMQPMDVEVVGLVVGALGAKAVQRKFEQPPVTITPNPSDKT